eukprot:gene13414-4280_t
MGLIKTTVIGSMTKPAYLKVPCWVMDGKFNPDYFEVYRSAFTEEYSSDVEDQLKRATKEIVDLQQRCGLDVITDGELRRVQYVYNFCRRFEGFDFHNTKEKVCRNGSWKGHLPVIVSKILHKDGRGFLAGEWKWAQEMSEKPIKVTVPGPMTIIDTFYDDFYNDDESLMKDLADCINIELKLLAEAGCREIQVDEPVLTRYPDRAIKYGVKHLSSCFDGLPRDVFKTDQTDYEKSDQGAYMKLASVLDEANIDAIAIEDKHRRNSPEMFKAFKKIKIVLGVIDVVKSRVETVDEICDHISDVLKYIPKERLIVAPDCGMIFLPLNLAEQKLTNMVKAAERF